MEWLIDLSPPMAHNEMKVEMRFEVTHMSGRMSGRGWTLRYSGESALARPQMADVLGWEQSLERFFRTCGLGRPYEGAYWLTYRYGSHSKDVIGQVHAAPEALEDEMYTPLLDSMAAWARSRLELLRSCAMRWPDEYQCMAAARGIFLEALECVIYDAFRRTGQPDAEDHVDPKPGFLRVVARQSVEDVDRSTLYGTAVGCRIVPLPEDGVVEARVGIVFPDMTRQEFNIRLADCIRMLVRVHAVSWVAYYTDDLCSRVAALVRTAQRIDEAFGITQAEE